MNEKKCLICGKILDKKHKKYCSQKCSKQKPAWNKGLTKETDKRVKKYGLKNKNKISWNKGINNSIEYICLNCGKKFNSYTKRKYCCKQCQLDYINKVKKNNIKQYTCKVCGKIFYYHTQRKVCSKECSYKITNGWNKGLTKETDKRVKQCGIAQHKTKLTVEWKNSTKGKKAILIARNNGRNKIHKNSCGELDLKKFLENKQFYFLHDKYLKDFDGRPDFYFPELNKVIEYNGCYWHAHNCINPNGYKGNDKRVLLNIERYNKKTKHYKLHNIQLLEIWECDWKNRQKECKERIIKFLEK